MSVLSQSFGPRVAISLIAALFTAPGRADEPLHVRIDALIAADRVGPASIVINDEEFLRRVSLDLTGEIPSAIDARAFLDDSSPTKRASLVDRLLDSPGYVRHMAQVFGVMLMERRADKGITSAEWHEYLRKSFAAKKPFNQLAREILSADGVDPVLRPAAKFYLDREGEPNLLTRDVGRIFFGRDLQCAQCHDHPIIESYYQADYYGLFACFNRGVLFTDPKDKDKKVIYAEKGEGGMAFHSVFDPDAKGLASPRLPGGLQLAEPTFAAGDEYTVKPADGVRPVPKYSRRARLAEEATSGANRAFNENIANRIWAHLFGLGLVEPVDLHHVDNPPSHPALLALLADELVAMKFDVKSLMREIVLSQTYQRAIDAPESELVANGDDLAAQVLALEAELQRLNGAAVESAKAVEQVQDELRVSRAATVDLAAEATKLAASMSELKKAVDAAQQALAQTKTAHAARQDAANAVTEAAQRIQEATEKLPMETSLAQAAVKFKQRADQLNAEVVAASKVLAEQTQTVATAAEKLANAQSAVQIATNKQNEANKQVDSLEAKSAAAIAKIQADRAAVKQIERRVRTVNAVISYRAARLARDTSRTEHDQLEAKLASARQSLAKLTADAPALKAALEVAQTQRAEAIKAQLEASAQLSLKDSLAKTVSLAADKALAASQKLTGDNELAAAAQAVKARADQLTGEASELQKLSTSRSQSAEQTARTVAAAENALNSSTAELTRLQQEIPALESQLQATAAKLGAEQQRLSLAIEALIQNETRQFATASLKPLSPEQLAASIMQAVGLTDQFRAAALAEVNAKTPLTDAIRNDPAQMAARRQLIEESTYAKVHANAARFVELFGAGAGQPQSFFAAADQALFLANDEQLRSWLAPASGNLTDRLAKLTDSRAVAEELYLSVLTRNPTEAEVLETTSYLSNRANERPAALQELAWALITSTEFRFNH